MTVVVLLILAALWVVVLAPPLLRARTEHRGGDSIGDFNYRLGALGKANGTATEPLRPPVTPTLRGPVTPFSTGTTAAQRSAKRRRDVFTALGVAAAVTFLLGIAAGGPFWAVHVLADVLLVAYAGLVAWYRQLASERLEKVRFLPQRAAPELAFRRSASS